MLEVQGENVRLELEGSFNWGNPSVTVRAVRYTFPHIHAALEGLLGTSASDTSIAVSGTQVLTVQCADETRYYRDGQRVERFILKKRMERRPMFTNPRMWSRRNKACLRRADYGH